MFLHERGVYWHLLDHPEFVKLRNVIDNTMKERYAMGLGVKKSAEVISMQCESKMFDEGVLGEDSPEKLLKTIIYMMGMHCALRGGMGHNKLWRPGCNWQFSIEKDNRGKECLIYSEDPLQKQIKEGWLLRGQARKCLCICLVMCKGVQLGYSKSMWDCFHKVRNVRNFTWDVRRDLPQVCGIVTSLMELIVSRRQ